jgi:hypothetical protein
LAPRDPRFQRRNECVERRTFHHTAFAYVSTGLQHQEIAVKQIEEWSFPGGGAVEHIGVFLHSLDRNFAALFAPAAIFGAVP